MAIERPLRGIEIGKRQFRMDDLDVGNRVDTAADMNHVRVIKNADHLSDRIDVANMPEELITQPFSG